MFQLKRIVALCYLCLLFLNGCGSSGLPENTIAIDPLWYASELPGKEKNVFAFSCELLQEISKVKKTKISILTQNWDMLLPNLRQKKYTGILSPMPPYLFNEKTYYFSDSYLQTGPVLILPFASKVDAFEKLSGKEIAILRGSKDALLLEKYPGILIRIYDSLPQAFNDVLKGVIDGAIAPVLIAQSYCTDIYHGELKVATAPLTQEGLRLVTLYSEGDELVQTFNEGLKELRSNGSYEKLLRKWKLTE